MIVFTVIEHKNICIAGLNFQAGYATEYVQTVFGHKEFRPGQKEAIESIFSGEDTVVIIPTGGGKTAIYTLPCIMTSGLAFVVSPLMLMSDQVARLQQCGTTLMVAHFVFLNLASIHVSQLLNAVDSPSFLAYLST